MWMRRRGLRTSAYRGDGRMGAPHERIEFPLLEHLPGGPLPTGPCAGRDEPVPWVSHDGELEAGGKDILVVQFGTQALGGHVLQLAAIEVLPVGHLVRIGHDADTLAVSVHAKHGLDGGAAGLGDVDEDRLVSVRYWHGSDGSKGLVQGRYRSPRAGLSSRVW